jgi:thiamine monophosphate kinase
VLEHAFCDGEDYELLFAVKANIDTKEFESCWRQQFPQVLLSRIGHIGKRLGTAPYLDAHTKEALPWVRAFEHLTGQ